MQVSAYLQGIALSFGLIAGLFDFIGAGFGFRLGLGESSRVFFGLGASGVQRIDIILTVPRQ